MPNCFALRRKDETEPTSLIKVDEELCKLLGVEVHPKRWVESWYDIFGWRIAVTGQSFAQLRVALTAPCKQDGDACGVHAARGHNVDYWGELRRAKWSGETESCYYSLRSAGELDESDKAHIATLVKILDHLEANYTTDTWVEIGKR